MRYKALVALSSLFACSPVDSQSAADASARIDASPSAVDAPRSPPPVALAETGPGARDLLVDATHVYWADDTAITRVARSGGPPEVLVRPSGPAHRLELAAGHVYWTSAEPPVIARVPVTGGEEDVLIQLPAGGGGARGLAVDEEHVYWTERTTVARLSLTDPVAVREVVAVGGQGLGDLAIDAMHVYYTDHARGHEVWRVSRAGGEPSPAFGVLALGGASSLLAFKSYVLQCGRDRIDPHRSLIAGFSKPNGTSEVLAIIPDTAMDSVAVSTFVYCAVDTGVYRVALSGGVAEAVAPGQHVVAVAADESHVFWLDQGAGGIFFSAR